MDRIRQIANGIGLLRGFALFCAFSAVVFLLGVLLGVFDHNPSDEGGVRTIYAPPTGERRF